METTEKVHFSVANLLCGMKMHLKSTPMNSRGQGHLATLPKGHQSVVCYYFQRTVTFLKPLGQFQLKFLQRGWGGGKFIDILGPGRVASMAAMAIIDITSDSQVNLIALLTIILALSLYQVMSTKEM